MAIRSNKIQLERNNSTFYVTLMAITIYSYCSHLLVHEKMTKLITTVAHLSALTWQAMVILGSRSWTGTFTTFKSTDTEIMKKRKKRK